jgi:hypothetical protein
MFVPLLFGIPEKATPPIMPFLLGLKLCLMALLVERN